MRIAQNLNQDEGTVMRGASSTKKVKLTKRKTDTTAKGAVIRFGSIVTAGVVVVVVVFKTVITAYAYAADIERYREVFALAPRRASRMARTYTVWGCVRLRNRVDGVHGR